MISFFTQQPSADRPAERRTERMEQRVRPSVKTAIENAAAVSGQDLTEFVTSAAYDRAVAVLDERLATRLPVEELQAFLAALDDSPEPNEALRALMADYEANVEDHIP